MSIARFKLPLLTGAQAGMALFCVALVIAVWILTFARIDQMEKEAIADAVRANDNLAVAFEERTIRTLQGLDQVLGFVRHEVAHGGQPDLAGLLEKAHVQTQPFTILGVFDEKGDLVASSRSWRSVNSADREFFRVHRDRREDELFIGKPVLGRLTGEWAIHLSRRVDRPDGSFGGIVMVAVRPEYFTSFFEKADLGANGLVTVVGLDGITRARRAGGRQTFGEDMSRSTILARQRMAPVGNHMTRGLLESVPRYFSYRTLEHYPFVVVVGRSSAEVLAPIAAQARTAYGVAGAVSVVTVLLCAVLLFVLARQKRMIVSIAESEQRYREIFEGAIEGIYQTTPEGRFVGANPAMARILGYDSPEELIASRTDIALGYVCPKRREEFKRLMEEQGLVSGFEAEHIRKDGSRVWVSDNARAVRDESGRIVRYDGTLEDIGARKRAEMAVSEVDRRKAAILESALDAIITIDHEGRILEFNAAAERIFGFARAGALGRDLAELIIPPDFRELHRAAVLNSSGPERPSTFLNRRMEIAALRSDGSQFPAELSITRIASDPPVFTGFVRDITDRRKAEAAVRESEERFRSVARVTADAVWDWNPMTGALWWSEGMQVLFGYRPEEIEPGIESWTTRIHPEDRERVVSHLETALDSGSDNYYDEYRFARKDGTYAFVVDRAFVIRDPKGRPIRMVGGMSDITERKLAEEAHASLEEQLREAQKMEAIGQLAGGVAHDFNNILGALLGNLELARQDVPADSPAHESLEEIRKAGHRARDLVQQILSFSRRQPTTVRPVVLGSVVEDSVRLLRATLPARAKIEWQCAPDVPTILADAGQIGQVLLNLGTNAAYAIGNRPGTIRIRVDGVDLTENTARRHAGLKPGRHARIVVSDNGDGMDNAILARIFEPFFTTKPVGDGTGLGLAVVHGIVRAHEGAIAVASTVGKGTRFELFFRAAEAAMPEDQSADRPRMPATGRGEQILYIDDDEALVFLVTRMLERRNYRVRGFFDQREALAAFDADPDAFRLVVTDYNMPGLSGIDIARMIRKARPGMPLAMASGYITNEMQAQAAAAGVDELIFKPHVVQEFCDVVERLLAKPAKKAA